MNDGVTVYTVITRDFNVVRKLMGVRGQRLYIVIIYTKDNKRTGPLLGQLKRYYGIEFKKGEPIIL